MTRIAAELQLNSLTLAALANKDQGLVMSSDTLISIG